MFPRNPPVPRPLTHAHKKRKWVEEGKGEKTSVLECLNNSRSREEEEEEGQVTESKNMCFSPEKGKGREQCAQWQWWQQVFAQKNNISLERIVCAFRIRKEGGGGDSFQWHSSKNRSLSVSYPSPLFKFRSTLPRCILELGEEEGMPLGNSKDGTKDKVDRGNETGFWHQSIAMLFQQQALLFSLRGSGFATQMIGEYISVKMW